MFNFEEKIIDSILSDVSRSNEKRLFSSSFFLQPYLRKSSRRLSIESYSSLSCSCKTLKKIMKQTDFNRKFQLQWFRSLQMLFNDTHVGIPVIFRSLSPMIAQFSDIGLQLTCFGSDFLFVLIKLH
jgi:hypothetical protein